MANYGRVFKLDCEYVKSSVLPSEDPEKRELPTVGPNLSSGENGALPQFTHT